MLEGMDSRGCASFGTAMAGMTLASADTVSSDISRPAVDAATEVMCDE